MKHFPTRFSSVSLAVLVTLLSGVPAWAAVPTPLVSGGGPEPRGLRLGPGVVRARGLRLNARALEAPELTLDLFPDVRVLAVRQAGGGSAEWWGRLPDHPLGSATFVVVGGVLAGSVAWPERAFEVRCDETGACGVREVDRAALRPSRSDDAVAPPTVDRALTVPVGGDSAGTIEMLVVYTAAGAAEVGGTAALNSAVALGVSSTNQAYANSGVLHRLRLLGTSPVSYSESGTLLTDLGRLQNPSDGFMDTVPPLRSSYRADIVQLIVASSDPVYTGFAYYAVSSSGGNAAFAYGVVEAASIDAAGGYTLGHEAGHNLGSNHDRANENPGSGAYPYSFGYNAPNGAFGTIMAYPCGVGAGCPHVLHFSNPVISYGGQATGVAESSPSAANNAHSMNNTAGIVANFQQAPGLSVSGATQQEPPSGPAAARFNVTLDAPTARTVMVDYFTSNGTATAGADYVARSGTLTFPPGTTVQPVDVSVIGDGLGEGTERFYLNLANPVDGNVTVSQAFADVSDPALITVNDVTVTETLAGVNATFTVSVANLTASTGTVTVNYTTADGTAQATKDYTAAAGTLTFSSSTGNQRTVTVPVPDDITDEFNETFTLNLSGATNALITDGQGAGAITDDDPLPMLAISDNAVVEGATGTHPATFTVTLSPASGKTVSVDYATANASASAGSDYLSTSGTLTFLPGVTTAEVGVTVRGDATAEANETYNVDLSNPVEATLADGTLYHNIVSFFGVSDPGFRAKTLDPVNGGPTGEAPGSPYATSVFVSSNLGLSRSGASFIVGVTGPNQILSYRVDPTGRLIAAPGAPPAVSGTPRRVGIDPLDRFAYMLTSSPQTVIGFAIDVQTGALTPIPGLPLTISAFSAPEGNLTVSPSGRFLYLPQPTSVFGFRIDPGTGGLSPIPGSPFAVGGNPFSMAVEPTERFGYVSDQTNSKVMPVAIDPTTGALSALGPPLTTPGQPADVMVDPQGRFLYAGTTNGVAAWTINANGSLTAFSGSPFGSGLSLSMDPAGRRIYGLYGDLSVLRLDPAVPTLTPVFGSPFPFPRGGLVVGSGGRLRGVGTILNDDGPALSVASISVAEGDSGVTTATVNVTLSAPSANTVTVDYSTADLTASRTASDYFATSGRLTFTPGQTLATVQVSVLGDTVDEPNETFTVSLQSASFASLGIGSGIVTILDDDGAPASAAILEVGHGSDQIRSLAAQPGPVAARHYYSLRQRPRSSYEVVIDGASGDVQPLTVRRMAADGTTTIQDAGFPGLGDALSLRWENSGSTDVLQQKVLVESGGCTTACGSDDTYRLRVYETTATIPRFNSSGSQVSVVILQNPTSVSIQGNMWFWAPNGALLASRPFNLPARQTTSVSTATIPELAGQSGSITISHNGRYGELVGKGVSLEPSTGFSFDTPLVPRPR